MNNEPTTAQRIVGLFILAITVIIVIALLNHHSGTPKYEVSSTYEVNTEQYLTVEGHVKNTGTKAGQPDCTVQAHDPGYGFEGRDAISDITPIEPGSTWDFTDTIKITGDGAAYVTQIDIKCH